MYVADGERGKVCEQVVIGFCFIFHWMTKWREYFEAIACRRNSKPCQTRITFEASTKTALKHYNQNKAL